MTGGVVLITGAAAGIGWAAAQAFATAGHRVLLADIDGARAAERATQLGVPHEGIAVDMADAARVVAMVAGITARHGRLDVLVNNAGRIDAGTPVAEQSLDGFRRLIALNLGGVAAASLEAAALMRRQGGGAIVNVASGAALCAIPLRNGYSASKAGVVALTRNHGLAFARDGVRVDAVAPGYTRTELVDRLIAEGRVDPAKAARRIPLGRMGKPEEIAVAILHLASAEASHMTGAPVIAVGPGPVGEALAARLAARGIVAASADRLDGLPRLDGLLNADPRPGEAGHLERLFLGAQAAGRIMLRQGSGAIVNLTSVLGQVGLADTGAAGPEAAAVSMLTRTTACEREPSGIRVNCIAAGPTAAEGAVWLPRVPLRRLAAPAEIAAVADFLLSPAAGFVAGSVVPVDGGLSANGGPDLHA